MSKVVDNEGDDAIERCIYVLSCLRSITKDGSEDVWSAVTRHRFCWHRLGDAEQDDKVVIVAP